VLGSEDAQLEIPTLATPAPVMAFAIEAKAKGDEDKIATGLGKNASAGQIYGASGLMHGKANVKWPSGSGEDLKKSEAEFRKGWGKDTDLIKGNFATKAKAYNDIHAALLRFLAARPDPAGAKKTGTSN